MFSGSYFEWKRPIRHGDRLTSKTILKDIEVKPSRFAGRAIKQIREATFFDQNGEVVAIARRKVSLRRLAQDVLARLDEGSGTGMVDHHRERE